MRTGRNNVVRQRVSYAEGAAMTTLCEVATCPAETPAQELVVVCTGFRQGSNQDLTCRFSNGTTVPAQLDTETQRISCKLPQVSSLMSRMGPAHKLAEFPIVPLS